MGKEAEKEEAVKEAVKGEIATIQDVLDTLTLEKKQESINILPEDSKPSEIAMEELPKEEKVQEKDEKKVDEKKAEEKKVDEKKAEEKKVDEKKVNPKVEMKMTRSRRSMMPDKENTPKIEAVNEKEGTPRDGTPLIKPSKLGTPNLGTPKTAKLGKIHPDEVESPRRITRNLLAKMGPNASK